MGGDLIPLPIIRFRGGIHTEEPGYDIPVHVKVTGRFVSWMKTILSSTVSFIMLWFLLYVNKGYLRDSDVTGFSRITLQHPTHHCNPLKANCKAKMSPFHDFEYCKRGETHEGAKGRNEVGCIYLDSFDIAKYDTSVSQVLIPTRISTYHQQESQSCLKGDGCEHPYTVLNETHDFVADIEDFTLLISHGFSCPFLNFTEASWSMLGFYRETGACGDTITKRISGIFHPSGLCEVTRKYIPCSVHNKRCVYSCNTTRNKVLKIYNVQEHEVGNSMNNTQYGDIVKVSELLRIAGIDLDSRNYGGASRREEGEVIIIDIHYTNYMFYSWPNQQDPTYEYKIASMPSDTFKLTHVHELGNGHRKVYNVHGIHVITRTSGMLGKFSLKSCFFSVVELSVALAFVNWILRCIVLNSEKGDLIMQKSEKTIYGGDHIQTSLMSREITEKSQLVKK